MHYSGHKSDLIVIYISSFFGTRKFINECPSGLITLHEFQRHFCDGTVGSESAEYAEQIFRTLDCNGVSKGPNGFMKRIPATQPYTISKTKMLKRSEHWPCFNEIAPPQDGVVDFREYVMAISMLIEGSAVEKLRWSFKLYDKDKDGAITREEMLEIMRVCVWVFCCD